MINLHFAKTLQLCIFYSLFSLVLTGCGQTGPLTPPPPKEASLR